VFFLTESRPLGLQVLLFYSACRVSSFSFAGIGHTENLFAILSFQDPPPFLQARTALQFFFHFGNDGNFSFAPFELTLGFFLASDAFGKR